MRTAAELNKAHCTCGLVSIGFITRAGDGSLNKDGLNTDVEEGKRRERLGHMSLNIKT